MRRDITLSNGKVCTHTRETNGAQRVTVAGEHDEMTEAEWEEYCAIIVKENR